MIAVDLSITDEYEMYWQVEVLTPARRGSLCNRLLCFVDELFVSYVSLSDGLAKLLPLVKVLSCVSDDKNPVDILFYTHTFRQIPHRRHDL